VRAVAVVAPLVVALVALACGDAGLRAGGDHPIGMQQLPLAGLDLAGIIELVPMTSRTRPPCLTRHTSAKDDPTPPMAWAGWPREGARVVLALTAGPLTAADLVATLAGAAGSAMRARHALAWADLAGLVALDDRGRWAVKLADADEVAHVGREPGWGGSRALDLAALLVA
jgi:hypothetical protein